MSDVSGVAGSILVQNGSISDFVNDTYKVCIFPETYNLNHWKSNNLDGHNLLTIICGYNLQVLVKHLKNDTQSSKQSSTDPSLIAQVYMGLYSSKWWIW